ncbi:MAG: putative toxin-antitoxin system toxin component, PIN family [Bryobacteraceae bacterium]
MRIVLDTNILVRAHTNARGPARDLLLRIVASPEHTLLLSPFLLQELERVFQYERIRIATRLTEDEINEYLLYLRSRSVTEMVFPGEAPRVVPNDNEDDPVVHAAVFGGAQVLCTLNRHFYDAAVVDYCKARGVTIVRDIELLRLLRALEAHPTPN